MKTRVAAAALIISLLASPVHSMGSWSNNAADEQLNIIFEEIEINGPGTDALEALEKFIRSYPYSDVTDEALLRGGNLYMELKEFNKAQRLFQKLLENFPASSYKMEGLYGLGYCQYRAGRMREARTALISVWSSSWTPVTLKVKAKLLLKTIDSASPTALKPGSRGASIGAALPLDGPYAAYGRKALRGILLAAQVFGELSDDDKTTVAVVVRALGADPDASIDVINEISQNPEIVGIVGPMLSSSAIEAAGQAQMRKLPMIVLSQKKGVPEVGDFVFRNFITPNQQAAAIASLAIDDLGFENFAILYPENTYGIEHARQFRNEILDRGGNIVGEESYKEDQKDFGEELKYLFGIEVEYRMQGRRQLRAYTSTVEVDALFIPDYPETIGQISPFLAFYNIKGVQLLGTNGWNSPKLVKLGGEYVEGAIFVDGFYSRSKRAGARSFTWRFREVYGYRPGLLEAQAYDAATMLISAIKGSGIDRASVRDRLRNIFYPNGATGDLYFDFNGDAVKDLFVLTVKDGAITEFELQPPPEEAAVPDETQPPAETD